MAAEHKGRVGSDVGAQKTLSRNVEGESARKCGESEFDYLYSFGFHPWLTTAKQSLTKPLSQISR